MVELIKPKISFVSDNIKYLTLNEPLLIDFLIFSFKRQSSFS